MKYKIKTLDVVLFALILALGAYKAKSYFVPLDAELVSKNDDNRNLALAKLQKLTPAKKESLVAPLIKHTSDTEPDSRRFAYYALRKVAVKSPDLVPAYIAGLSDNDEEVRKEAGVALLETGAEGLPALIGTFRGGEPVAEHEAYQLLEKMGSAAVPHLIPLLSEDDAPALKAAVVLKKIGPLAEEAAPALQKTFSDKKHSLEVRVQAALAYNAVYSTSSATVPVYVEALKAEDWDSLTWEAAAAVEKIGPSARAAAPALTHHLKISKDNYANANGPRGVLTRTLEKVDVRRREQIDLGFDIKQKDPVIRYRAAYVISQMDKVPVGLMGTLVESLADKDNFVAARSLYSLEKLGLANVERVRDVAYPRILNVLGRAAKDPNIGGFVELAAAEAAKIGDPIRPYVERSQKKGEITQAMAELLAPPKK